MKTLGLTIVAALILTCSPVLADIPVDDAAQLTQHSETSSIKVKLVPITTQRQDANSGVKCAVTTGKKANISDPTVQPQSGAGAAKIQGYAPNVPASPTPGAQGAALNSQTFFKSTGDVVSGLDASGSTLTAARSRFQSAAQQVGTAPTVMAAIDMNSAARLQNNFAWNGAIGSANLWVTALNALNLALNSDMSRAALGMRANSDQPQPAAGARCPTGTVGAGTPNDPCRVNGVCSTTPPGSSSDPACVTARYVDTNGNVLFYLAGAQAAAQAANNASLPSSASTDTPLTVTDVAAALALISTNSR